MKKQLLTGAFILGALFTAEAQNSCADAIEVTSGATFTVDEITGEYQEGCWQNDGEAGAWYKVTAPANGAYRVNTNFGANAGGDTRVSVYSGESCNDLTCWDGSDDVFYAEIDEDGTPDPDNVLLTDFQFPAVAGETYYIQFDDIWSADGFQAEITFLEPGCTTNTLTENWSNIASYYFCWSTEDLNNDGEGDDNTFALRTTNNWDDIKDNDNVVIIFSGEEANDDYLVSNSKSLIGGNTYTVSVKYNGVNTQNNATPPVVTEADQSFEVVAVDADGIYMLGEQTGITQNGELLTDLEGNAPTGTFTFTPEADGEYSFAIHSNTEGGTGALLIFEINVTGTMGVTAPSVASFSVSPNPANTVVTIANGNNALVNAVSVSDMNGRVVKTAAFDGVAQAQVNVSDLANGVYMMTISSDKGSVTKKIVKN